MKKESYLHYSKDSGQLVSTPGTWVNRGNNAYLVELCSDSYETEHVVYHFEPQAREAAIEWINARPAADPNGRTLDEYRKQHPEHVSKLPLTE